MLRRFAEQLPPGDKPARAGDLWNFIARDLDESGYGLSAETMKYVQRIARSAGALILLDGLDECGDSARRERVLGAVAGAHAHRRAEVPLRAHRAALRLARQVPIPPRVCTRSPT